MGESATREPRPVVQPEDDTDAPGDLAVIEAFVNTYDLEGDEGGEHEVFTDPTVLGRWLRKHGLLEDGERIEEPGDLDRAIEVREALRRLLMANHDGVEPPPDALEVLAREAGAAPLAVDLRGGIHAHLRPVGDGIDRALATLFAIVFHAMHDGTWERLKVCRSDTCRWAFYDSSRNRSGKWCDMAVCGNRTKVANYRERHG